MKRNNMAMTALGLGAAYLMRSKDSRNKLKNQMTGLTKNSKR